MYHSTPGVRGMLSFQEPGMIHPSSELKASLQVPYTGTYHPEYCQVMRMGSTVTDFTVEPGATIKPHTALSFCGGSSPRILKSVRVRLFSSIWCVLETVASIRLHSAWPFCDSPSPTTFDSSAVGVDCSAFMISAMSSVRVACPSGSLADPPRINIS